MNKNKFEEGETCDDSTVDPDIALSYIVCFFPSFFLFTFQDYIFINQCYIGIYVARKCRENF